MEILIVAITRMQKGKCVGGLVMDTLEKVRIINYEYVEQLIGKTLQTGFVIYAQWGKAFNSQVPHIEDIYISHTTFLYTRVAGAFYLKNMLGIPFWQGDENIAFEGMLEWTHYGTGYIPKNGPFPSGSVGFWCSSKDLILDQNTFLETQKVKYLINGTNKKISFVGFQNPPILLMAGTLLRISLSRVFKPEYAPFGFYLQLSGWYF